MTSPKRIVKRNKSRTYLEGDKPYFKLAKKVFPFLVRQAIANGQAITYSALAEEVGKHHRNMAKVLGTIGEAINLLNTEIKNAKIPPIQGLVVNKKTQLPGKGFDGWYGSLNLNNDHFTPREKHGILKEKISTYPKWDWVLEQFGLDPLSLDIDGIREEISHIRFGGGEKEPHRLFKEAIAKNPHLPHLKVDSVEIEKLLLSGDRIDIFFKYGNMSIGVEVKPSTSGEGDVIRGIFQCVKYKCIIEAEQMAEGLTPNSKVILALQSSLPSKKSIQIKNILGIEVIENININSSV